MEALRDRGTSRAEMLTRLKWLVGLRLAVVALFLGSAVVIQLRADPPFPPEPLFAIIAFVFLLSLLYTVALPRVRNLILFCFCQVAVDILVSTGLVHVSGGKDSPFTFVYIFPIFAAATLLGRRGGLGMASVASILYGGLINLEFYGVLPAVATGAPARAQTYLAFQVFINIAGFFLVALLSSHLAERLRETARRLEERSLDLRALESLHRDVVANVPSGLMTLDAAGRIVAFNRAAEAITGYGEAEVRDRPYQAAGFSEVPGVAAFVSGGGPPPALAAGEVTVVRRDGVRIPAGISLSPLWDQEGRVRGLVAVFQDLSDKKRIEEQLRRADRLAAVGQLAASIAHEIRNPLAAISGSIQVLQEEMQPQGQNRQLVDIILREADRLKLITGQFLDFVRPRTPLRKECELITCLEETVLLLKQRERTGAEVVMDFTPPEAPVVVSADDDQLRQVFWNISLNAVEAMPEGGTLRVAVRDFSADPDHPTVAVEFADTGGGIRPEENLDRIFEPFFTTKETGTGLGLSIARRVVEELGGRIEVENRPGEGATFRVVLKRLA
ncbi:MAG: PAS domain S-box protein [candidate division NC10 bacterium]|nr:PAS domain S-box protein [candidate division NC10 bacterium]